MQIQLMKLANTKTLAPSRTCINVGALTALDLRVRERKGERTTIKILYYQNFTRLHPALDCSMGPVQANFGVYNLQYRNYMILYVHDTYVCKFKKARAGAVGGLTLSGNCFLVLSVTLSTIDDHPNIWHPSNY